MSWAASTDKSLITIAALNAGAKAADTVLQHSNAPIDMVNRVSVGMGIIFNPFQDVTLTGSQGEAPETLPVLRERVDFFVNDFSADLLRGSEPVTAEYEAEVHLFEKCAHEAMKAIEAHMAKKSPSPSP